MNWVVFFCALASLLFALARFGPALDRAGAALGWKIADRVLIPLRVAEIQWEDYRSGLAARLARQDAVDAAARARSAGLWQVIRPAPPLDLWQAIGWLCPECHHGNHQCVPGRCCCTDARW